MLILVSGASAGGSGIDRMNPKTQEEFDTFREALRHKLQTLEARSLVLNLNNHILSVFNDRPVDIHNVCQLFGQFTSRFSCLL